MGASGRNSGGSRVSQDMDREKVRLDARDRESKKDLFSRYPKLASYSQMDEDKQASDTLDYAKNFNQYGQDVNGIYHPGVFNGDDRQLQTFIHQVGLNDKPTLVDSKNFDSMVKANAVDGNVIYRGVVDGNPGSIIDYYKTGDYTLIGMGIYGQGNYFSNSKATARSYSDGNPKNIVKAYIDKHKASVIDYTQLRHDFRNSPYSKYVNSSSKKANGLLSVYALNKGYNVIRVDQGYGENYYVALDRSALVFEK